MLQKDAPWLKLYAFESAKAFSVTDVEVAMDPDIHAFPESWGLLKPYDAVLQLLLGLVSRLLPYGLDDLVKDAKSSYVKSGPSLVLIKPEGCDICGWAKDSSFLSRFKSVDGYRLQVRKSYLVLR